MNTQEKKDLRNKRRRELYAQRKIEPKKKVTRLQGSSSLSTGNNVSPGSSGWTVKVVVAEKFSPRIAQKSPTKYQNLILMDTELCIPTDEKDFTEIKNIQGPKTVKQFFWIKGKASVTVLNQNYWYMSCNNCNKISSENYGDIYHCVFCKCLEAQAIPR
ncbi:Uncharacterized protein Fot_12681 [Forsythia ovata]|uniref:Uncharacterized protein n=1 Tax=Forsythia ovata TaxID=205694 RepID=A0ABD1WNL6_9LAMI